MNQQKHLCIVADDFGMHPAVNEGIAKAFADGILTDSNLMAPTPEFEEACRLARDLGIPSGIHATFTCEWDLYRWGPLTGAPTLADAGGRFRRSVEQTWQNASLEEARAELRAQHDAIRRAGIEATHVGQHMGVDRSGKFESLINEFSAERNLPYKGSPGLKFEPALSYAWDSAFIAVGPATLAEAKANHLKRLAGLTPGYHMWVTHPAIDHESMDSLCTPAWPDRRWAREFRAMDLAMLLDPEIRDVIESNGIEIAPMTSCPVRGGAGNRP